MMNLSSPAVPRRLRWGWAIGALATALMFAACTSAGPRPASTSQPSSTSPMTSTVISTPAAAPRPRPSTTGPARGTGSPVHIRMLEEDTYGPPTYGVGMPIVVYFSQRISEARDFVKATSVTVNGTPAQGYWYFENSSIDNGFPVQASFIPFVSAAPAYAHGLRTLWPANSDVHMTMNTTGVTGGRGWVFDNSLTLHMHIGDAHVSEANCQPGVEHMTSTDNGKAKFSFPVSCGSAELPTYTGVKVVMQKGETEPGTDHLRPNGGVMMRGPGYADVVDYSVRITNSGEYVHDAPWNVGNIGARSTSHGCTNLLPADSIAFYHWAVVGDVVISENTGGKKLPSYDGYGTHNLSLQQLRSGGLVRTS